MAIASATLLAIALLNSAPFALVWGAVCMFFFAVPITMSNAMVLALDPLPRIAGVASSIIGTIQSLAGAAPARQLRRSLQRYCLFRRCRHADHSRCAGAAVSAYRVGSLGRLVPGCHQWDPGILLCETLHEYQHCRTLLRDGKVLGCRAGLAFEGAFAEPRAASSGTYDVALRSRVSATVHEKRRGEGRLRGEARYKVAFNIPEHETSGRICLQRDRYVYQPTGPEGGASLSSRAPP